MNPDMVNMVHRGINSEFWTWYVKEVLEPEYTVAKNVLLKGEPIRSSEDLGKQSFYKGVIYVLERIRKNPETWLEISEAHKES